MNREEVVTELFESMSKMRHVFAHAHGKHEKDLPTRAQLCILLVIAHHGPQGLKELAERMHMTPSAANQLADALVQEGMVAREEDASDRRKIILSLTKDGQKRLEKAKKQRLASMKTLLEALDDKELMQLRDLQRKILARLSS